MAKYKVRLRDKDGRIINKVVQVKGFLSPRLLHKEKVYIYDKRDVDGIPYFYQIMTLWSTK